MMQRTVLIPPIRVAAGICTGLAIVWFAAAMAALNEADLTQSS